VLRWFVWSLGIGTLSVATRAVAPPWTHLLDGVASGGALHELTLCHDPRDRFCIEMYLWSRIDPEKA